ncbi:MAG: hypothetical protein Q7K28_02915, partial [Candidatus Wildermuthbacteria bacterium]|nr:hypothetical protein [Candidatus Wildermuthbacteria bacterium]
QSDEVGASIFCLKGTEEEISYLQKDFIKIQKKKILIITKGSRGCESFISGKKYTTKTKKELTAKNVNWLSGQVPSLPLRVQVKIRYRHQAVPVVIYKLPFNKIQGRKTKNYKLVFDKPQRAITPGQSVVFYRGQELLGGGIIVNM